MPSTQLVSYNFSTIENPLSNGGNFTTLSDTTFGDHLKAIAGNICECNNATNSPSGALYSGISWPNDQYSEATIVSLTNNVLAQVNLLVRQGAAASGSHYILRVQGNGLCNLLAFVSNTAHSLIANLPITVSPGDVWRLSVLGNVLTISRNGTTIATFTDTNNFLTSGSAGFGLVDNSAITDAKINLWAGGSVSNPSGGGLGTGTLMGNVIIDLDGNGFPIAESQVGTDA